MLIAITCLAAATVASATDRATTVNWGDNKKVSVTISYPKLSGKLPALIIAPGRSGGMNTSVIKGLANKAVRDGIIAIRFDYDYFTKKGEPSNGLVDETAQYKAVIAQALKDPKVDPRRIVLAGKSLGSVVAHRAFSDNPEYLGEVLLTPVIPTMDDGERLYPGLALAKRPVAMVIGNQDVENAPLGVVYNMLKDGSRKIMLNVVAGDHGFMVSPATDSSSQMKNQMNIDSALEMAGYWVRQITKVMPPAPPASK